MKKTPLLLVGFCFATIHSFSQATRLRYTIAPWFENKKAAASITFDDAVNGQFTFALPLLNQHGFRATFFLTTRFVQPQLGGWQLIKTAAEAGHEMANHTVNHPSLGNLPADSIARELVDANQSIDEQIQPAKSLTHAYPNGNGGGETADEITVRAVVKKYFIGARATRNSQLPYNPYDFAATEDHYFKVNSDMMGDWNTASDIPHHLDSTIQAGGWYVPTYHGIENGWLIVKKKVFESHLQEYDRRKNALWIAPFGEVLKYHKERNCARLRVVSEDATAWILELSDTLANNTVWNQPLTISLVAPTWTIKDIRQAGFPVPFTISGNRLVLNAVPDLGHISIRKARR